MRTASVDFGIISGVKTSWTLILVAAAFAAFADAQPFERYQTIIDRKPFGPEPVNFDPEAAPGAASADGGGEMTPEQRSAEAQQLAASVRVSALNVTPSGAVKVGFTDTSSKTGENYYLEVGASQNGWSVKGADPATESVTLVRDGIEVTMKLGETVGGKGANAQKRRGAAERPAAMPLLGGQPVADSSDGAPGKAVGGMARLRQVRMAMRAKEQADEERRRETAAAAEAERKEREAQEAAEKQRAAEERAQQREELLQIKEEIRRQREAQEAARKSKEEEQGEADNAE